MDENIISLDRDSTEGFVAVLDKLQDKFKQLLIISHIQEVKDMFRESVEIIKINGISKINELR
jgi:DNA repair exonuclease SbcCD ATPase subunit